MALFENFPYTNFHELNLDWVVTKLAELNNKFDDAISAKISFADPIQWDITRQYTALTIVMDNNKAYLSMQPVPAGTDINNTDYWQNIFDMSELINEQEEFEQEVTDRLDDLSDTIDEGLEKLENEKMPNNTTKHVLWCGDSYTTWWSGKAFQTFVNVSGVPAAQCHNVAETGAGFLADGVATFLSQIQNYTGDKEEITDIIVCGGINDALLAYNTGSADTTQLQAAIIAFAAYAALNYPNAKLHAAYVGGCMANSQYYATLHPHISQQWALWAYSVFAGGHGFNVLKTWNALHVSNLNYYSDGLHPNENYGAVAIGEAVANAFNGNPMVYNRPETIFNLTATGKNTRNMQAFMTIKDDIFTLETPDAFIQITQGETVNADSWSDILTFENYLIRDPVFINGMVLISGFSGMTAPKIVPAAFQIRDGIISMKIYSLNGTSFETLTATQWSPVTIFCLNSIELPLWSVN